MSEQIDIATVAQLALAEDQQLDAATIRVNCFRDYPDLTVLDDLFQRQQSGQEMPTSEPGSWLAFIFSKPEISASEITVQCLAALNQEGEQTGEYWIKMKSAAAISTQFSCQEYTGDPAQRAQTQWLASKQQTCNTEFAQQLISGGPDWLRSEPLQQQNTIFLPTVVTPMDVPARFAGHCYIKLLGANHPWL